MYAERRYYEKAVSRDRANRAKERSREVRAYEEATYVLISRFHCRNYPRGSSSSSSSSTYTFLYHALAGIDGTSGGISLKKSLIEARLTFVLCSYFFFVRFLFPSRWKDVVRTRRGSRRPLGDSNERVRDISIFFLFFLSFFLLLSLRRYALSSLSSFFVFSFLSQYR